MKNFKGFACIILFLFFGSFVWSQSTDTLTARSFGELRDIINENITKDSLLALSASKEFTKKAIRENHSENEWLGYQAMAAVYVYAESLDKAKDEVEKMIDLSIGKERNDLLIKSYQTLGGIYMREGVLSKSIETYYKAMDVAKSMDDIIAQQETLTYISMVKSIVGDYDSSIVLQKDVLARIKNHPVKPGLLSEAKKERLIRNTEIGIIHAYLRAKNGDSAFHYATNFLKKNLETKDTCTTKAVYMQLGQAELLLNRLDAAKKSFDYATTYCKPLTKFDSLLLGGYYGKYYYAKGQNKEAINSFEQAFETYQVSENEEGFMDDFYKVLANAYKEEGNLDKANFYFEKYIHTASQYSKIQDSVGSTFREKELENFQAELSKIKAEKEQQKGYLIYVSLGAFLVILALLFFLLRFYKRRKEDELKFQALLDKMNLETKTGAHIIDTKDEVLEDKSASEINHETMQQIVIGLEKLEQKEYFLSQECSSYNVAKKIKTNTSYLSKVVNLHYKKNFNTYINDLRINYAILRLKNDRVFRSFSIQSISEELGYKSADSFTKYFKQHTGLNPSFYVKQLNNLA